VRQHQGAAGHIDKEATDLMTAGEADTEYEPLQHGQKRGDSERAGEQRLSEGTRAPS